MSVSSQTPEPDKRPLSFAQRLASSEAFGMLFKEGMALVEACAAYLDGEGRAEARQLSKVVAGAYASESMRLTTRLMQVASWLLLQRAVNEGEMTQAQAASEKRRVKLAVQDLAADAEMFARLPQTLQDLCRQSMRLQSRIRHLDDLLYGEPLKAPAAARPSSIERQLERLRAAFEQRA